MTTVPAHSHLQIQDQSTQTKRNPTPQERTTRTNEQATYRTSIIQYRREEGTLTDHVLHAVGDVEGESGGGSAGAPGDVAEGGAEGDHAVHPVEEVVDTLVGLGGEVLEGEEDLPLLRRRLPDLLYHLHLLPLPTPPPPPPPPPEFEIGEEGGGWRRWSEPGRELIGVGLVKWAHLPFQLNLLCLL